MTIQIPKYDHIDQIRQLNSKYLITHLTNAQRQNGFIRIVYDRDDLQQIIANKEIVIATSGEKVIAYYLIGKRSGKAALDYQKNKANSLFDTNEIPFDQIGYGCQVCIDVAYRNNGLFGQMLNALFNIAKAKYTHLLCSVSDDNIVSLKTHETNGWQLIDSFESTKFFIYKILKPTLT
jgi:GNAT superfamily N-acetyltransferase